MPSMHEPAGRSRATPAVAEDESHAAARDQAFRVARAGVRAVAVLFGVTAVLSLIYGVLTETHRVHLWAGYFILGEFARYGPVAYLLYGFLNVVCTVGLVVCSRFARWLAILLLAWGLVQSVPAATNAVIDQHFAAVVWWGGAIILRVVALWYLAQPPVCDDFR